MCRSLMLLVANMGIFVSEYSVLEIQGYDVKTQQWLNFEFRSIHVQFKSWKLAGSLGL